MSRGFFATLSPGQQKAALEYRGPDYIWSETVPARSEGSAVEQNQYAPAIEFLERELLKAELLAESIRYSLTVLREKGQQTPDATAAAVDAPPQRGGS